METLLTRFGRAGEDDTALWIELVDKLRPPRSSQTERATENLRALTRLIADRPELRTNLRTALDRLFQVRKQVSLYVASGLLPSTGFFTESARRLSRRVLPDVIDPAYMKDLLSAVFHRADDEIWVGAIPDEAWTSFLNTLLAPAGALTPHDLELPRGVGEILEALTVLSYHVSAIGLDPELVRVDADLEEYESPFIAQNAEVLAYVAQFRDWWDAPDKPANDDGHLTVMLSQCRDVLLRVRRKATRIGTSLTLTFKLERLRQHLERIDALLALLTELQQTRDLRSLIPTAPALFKQLVHAECRKNRLSDYWSQNVELLSLRMTESASRTGERYITTTRGEYLGIVGSAALGGVIIALMAALKIILARQGFAPLNEALSFCLNYGIGFVLIHLLGGTVATKQPAMTANAIAASIGETQGRTGNLEDLADLVTRTVRSQIGAILGNVGVAIPVAILLSLAIQASSGAPFIDDAKAAHLLHEIDPRGGALFFAGVAGVCLFLSGLISGYYDNLAAYNRIPQRLAQLRWPQRILGVARTERIAAYVENNLGALAGNFFFGFLLGGATAIGVLFGLPLDIRHIAFSSAYVGYASAALDFSLPWQAAGLALLGVALIGAVNLTVSFTLTLYVAMRARRISFAQGRSLGRLLLKRMLTRPRDFLLPPPESKPPRQAADTPAAAPAEMLDASRPPPP